MISFYMSSIGIGRRGGIVEVVNFTKQRSNEHKMPKTIHRPSPLIPIYTQLRLRRKHDACIANQNVYPPLPFSANIIFDLAFQLLG